MGPVHDSGSESAIGVILCISSIAEHSSPTSTLKHPCGATPALVYCVPSCSPRRSIIVCPPCPAFCDGALLVSKAGAPAQPKMGC